MTFQTFFFVFLTLLITKPLLGWRPENDYSITLIRNKTFWTLGDKNPLVSPKFKNKRLAGLEWYKSLHPESDTTQQRSIEWLWGSDSDSQSADATGFFTEIFGEDEDPKKDNTNLDLRQHHRRRYVKVDKVLLPLLMAYKLKFFTMIPLLIGALVLLVSTTGLAGFFFALFAAAAGLHVKVGHH